MKEVSKIRYREVIPVLNSLSKKNIPYAIIKGEPLSIDAYGEEGMRRSGDIDLLISLKNTAVVRDELLSYGFESKNNNREHQVAAITTTNQSIPFRKTVDEMRIEVDLNHDIFLGELTGKRVNVDDFISDVKDVKIYGYSAKTIPCIKSFLLLTLHHYYEFNSIYIISLGKNKMSFNMLRDVFFLWKNNKDIISNNLYDISCKHNVVPYVYYILYYTNKIFNDNEFALLVEKFETEEGVGLLHCYGLSEAERKTWKVDFFTRLNNEYAFDLIKYDLTVADKEKLERARAIFG